MGDWEQMDQSPRLLEGERNYFSVTELLTSPFVIGQLILNIVVSFCGPFFFFWIIFVVLGLDEYGCYSSQVLSPILISPFASPVLALAWAPVGMLDAMDKGWFGFVRDSDLESGIFRFLPLGFRIGFVRHLLIGCQLAVVAIPVMMMIVVFGIAHESDESDGKTCVLSQWEQVFACVTYIAVLPIFIIPVGLLGFAKESNYQRVYRILIDKSFIMKGIYSPTC